MVWVVRESAWNRDVHCTQRWAWVLTHVRCEQETLELGTLIGKLWIAQQRRRASNCGNGAWQGDAWRPQQRRKCRRCQQEDG